MSSTAHDASPDGDPRSRAPRRRQKVVPHLSCQDPFAALGALAGLCRVFGFTEVRRFDRGENNLTVRLRGSDGGVVMISGRDEEFTEWMGRTGAALRAGDRAVPAAVDPHCHRLRRQRRHPLPASPAPKRHSPTTLKDQPWGVRS